LRVKKKKKKTKKQKKNQKAKNTSDAGIEPGCWRDADSGL
jgi:hypothetical protein